MSPAEWSYETWYQAVLGATDPTVVVVEYSLDSGPDLEEWLDTAQDAARVAAGLEELPAAWSAHWDRALAALRRAAEGHEDDAIRDLARQDVAGDPESDDYAEHRDAHRAVETWGKADDGVKRIVRARGVGELAAIYRAERERLEALTPEARAFESMTREVAS